MGELVDVVMPDSDQEGTESVVASWFKAVGDSVSEHAPLLEINTDKVSVEIPSPVTGVLREILKNENDEVQTGEVLGRIDASGAAAGKTQEDADAKEKITTSASSEKTDQKLSPAVKKLLKEHKVSPAQISGTGRDGRITHQDVMNFIGGAPKSSGGKSRMVPHSPMRKRIAEHMVQSALNTAPHVTTVFSADLSNVLAHREKYKDEFESNGVRLTLTSYFVRACVEAIREVPEVNSTWHDNALEIYNDCNIGIATALEKGGLIVPVVMGAQEMELLQTARSVEELTTKARDGTLAPGEVQNGTFTISNHGVSGSLLASPIIINQPQSAILGVGKNGETSCRGRQRRQGGYFSSPDGLPHPYHRPPGARWVSGKYVPFSLRKRA